MKGNTTHSNPQTTLQPTLIHTKKLFATYLTPSADMRVLEMGTWHSPICITLWLLWLFFTLAFCTDWCIKLHTSWWRMITKTWLKRVHKGHLLKGKTGWSSIKFGFGILVYEIWVFGRVSFGWSWIFFNQCRIHQLYVAQFWRGIESNDVKWEGRLFKWTWRNVRYRILISGHICSIKDQPHKTYLPPATKRYRTS